MTKHRRNNLLKHLFVFIPPVFILSIAAIGCEDHRNSGAASDERRPENGDAANSMMPESESLEDIKGVEAHTTHLPDNESSLPPVETQVGKNLTASFAPDVLNRTSIAAEDEYDPLLTMHSINAFVGSLSNVIHTGDRIILDQEYHSILNNLKLGNIEADRELINLFRVHMDMITSKTLRRRISR